MAQEEKGAEITVTVNILEIVCFVAVVFMAGMCTERERCGPGVIEFEMFETPKDVKSSDVKAA